eukprot:11207050-Alexandrium_andersonii.AAC.1
MKDWCPQDGPSSSRRKAFSTNGLVDCTSPINKSRVSTARSPDDPLLGCLKAHAGEGDEKKGGAFRACSSSQ